MDDKLNPGQQGSANFCNGHNSLTLSDEDSFVVLSNPSGQFTSSDESTSPSLKAHPTHSVDTMQNNVGSMKPSIDGHNSGFVMGSFSTDFSPEDIQKKLNEVLQENVSLKETLYQNNLAMRQQLTTFGTWQADVAKLHQSHKEKFSETRELILKLRTENEELKKALKDANSRVNRNAPSTSDSTLMSTNASLLKQVEQLQSQVSALTMSAKNEQQVFKSVTSKKEQELISLTEQLNRQLEIAERSRRQLGVDVERLQAQKTRLEREMAAIRTDLDAQKERTTVAETEKQKLQHMCTTSEQEIEHLKAGMKKCVDVIKELKRQGEPNLLKTPDKDIKPSLEQQEKKQEDMVDKQEKQAVEYSGLASWQTCTPSMIAGMATGADSVTIERLQTKINELQHMLAAEQELGRDRIKIISEGQEQFKSLFSQYQEALQHLDEFKKNQDSNATNATHRNSYYEVQVRGFTEKIDCMTAQVMKLEDDVLRRDQKIAAQDIKIKELETENETIPLLQIQMEVYQTDFNAEREARENLAGDKEQMAEDLRLLQRRNQQLLGELKQYQQSYGEQLQNPPSVNSGWTTVNSSNRNRARENTPPSPGPFDN